MHECRYEVGVRACVRNDMINFVVVITIVITPVTLIVEAICKFGLKVHSFHHGLGTLLSIRKRRHLDTYTRLK